MKKTLLIGIAAMLASYGFAQTATPPAQHDKAVMKDMHKDRDSINAKTKRIDDKQVDIKGDKKELHQEKKEKMHAQMHGDKKSAQKHKQAVKNEKQDIKQDKNAIHHE